MNAMISFLNENYIYIITIIAIVLGLLVYISFNKIEMNITTDKKLVKTVTVETFVNDDIPDKNILFQSTPYTKTDSEDKELDFNGANSFCENYRGQSGELNKACEYLTNDNCKSSSCCVLVQGSNGNKCMAGSANGPTYKKDVDGNLISIDSYYYKEKQYP
jgi:hypothetical protein